jgi:FkbM family methyltransferase
MFKMFRLLKKSLYTLRHESFSVFAKKIKLKIVYVYKNLTFKPYEIEKSIAGGTIRLIISDLFSKHWYDRPHKFDYWPELLWIKENVLKEGDIVVDCGANIGFTGIFYAQCVGNTGQVIGFEALASNAETVRKNIKLNQVKNFEIRNEAVGSFQGIVDFTDYRNGSVGRIDGYKVITVPVVTLDDAIKNQSPTFIKIDVEGYEIEVLKGATEILKTRPKLEVEIHCAAFKNRLEDVKELLSYIPFSAYDFFIQLLPQGDIQHHIPNDKTAELIAQYNNVHLFALPKADF